MNRYQWLWIVALALCVLAGCGGTVNSDFTPLQGAVGPSPVTTDIALHFGNPIDSAEPTNNPYIPVTVGNGKRIWVLFDTGSAGLHILQSALTPGTYPAQGSEPTKFATYGGNGANCKWSGYAARADIKVGDIDLHDQYFDVVTAMSPSPNCGGGDVGSLQGILGARPALVQSSDDARVVNPMTRLPSPFNNGFIVSLWKQTPVVTVGLTSANLAEFSNAEISVDTATSTSSPSASYWVGDPSIPYARPATFSWCAKLTPPDPTAAGVTTTCMPDAVTDSGGVAGNLLFLGTPPPWQPPATAMPGLDPSVTQYAVPRSHISLVLQDPRTSAETPIIVQLPVAGGCQGFNNFRINFGASFPGGSPTVSPWENNLGLSPFLVADVLYEFGLPGHPQNEFGLVQKLFDPPTPQFCNR